MPVQTCPKSKPEQLNWYASPKGGCIAGHLYIVSKTIDHGMHVMCKITTLWRYSAGLAVHADIQDCYMIRGNAKMIPAC